MSLCTSSQWPRKNHRQGFGAWHNINTPSPLRDCVLEHSSYRGIEVHVRDRLRPHGAYEFTPALWLVNAELSCVALYPWCWKRLNLCWRANEAAAWEVQDRKIVQLKKQEHEYMNGDEVMRQKLRPNTTAQRQEEVLAGVWNIPHSRSIKRSAFTWANHVNWPTYWIQVKKQRQNKSNYMNFLLSVWI